MSKVFYFILALAIAGGSLAITNPFDLPLVYAQQVQKTEYFDYTLYNLGNNTFQHVTHDPFFEDENGIFMPYRLTENNDMVQVEVHGAKVVFDKNSGAVTTFTNGTMVIQSDSYIVRGAELDTDNWFPLEVNNEQPQVIVSQSDDENSALIIIRKQNNEGVFDIEYNINNIMKATAKFTNQQYPNHKFAFTETLNLVNPIIDFNSEQIDIRNYVGQTFPRQVLEENQNLILNLQDSYYNSGLGFDNLWSVSIFDNNRIALDYANVEQTQTEIGQTVELDPTVVLNSSWSSFVISSSYGNHWVEKQWYLQGKIRSQFCDGDWRDTQNSPYDTTLTTFQVNNICPNGGNKHWGASFNFDIRSIPDNAVVTDTDFKFQVTGYTSGQYAIRSYDGFTKYYPNYNPNSVPDGAECPTTSTCQAYYNSIGASTADWQEDFKYWSFDGTSNNPYFVTGNVASSGSKNVDLGTAGDNSLMNYLSRGKAIYPINITGDTVGGNDSFSVATFNYGTSSQRPELTIVYTLPPPDDPTGLTITQDTAGELDLAWTQTGTVTGFKIERSLDNSSWTTLTSDTGNTNTTYTDTGLSAGTLYYYRVYSYDSATSQYSTNPTTNSETTWDYPEQVTGLTATGGDPISLSWSVPASDDTIINYKVYRDTVFLKTVAGTSTTDSPPSYGTSYSYTVSAVSSVGEGAQSASSSATFGVPPDPPTSVSTSISNPNSNPLDVLVSYSSPAYVGSGTLTGFEIVRDGSVIATIGLVSSYTDTVPSAGTYTYLVRAISTHGISSDSNTSNITTPTTPSAINNLSATANSDTTIALSWSSPNNGGSAITLYKIFQDAVQIDTTTNTSYTVTGLTPNTSYDFTVIASNNVGDSTASNTATQTTYLEITGHIDLTATTQGSTTQFIFSANVTAGTPTPTFSTFNILKNGVTIASNISSPYNLKLTDTASNTYTIISTDNTHWNTPSINGTVSGITASYQADWQTDLLGSNEIAYDLTRANDQLNLVVNRDTGTNTWHLNCNYRTNTQILAGNNGTWYEVNSWYYNDTQGINDASIVYIDCYNDDLILQITSYSSDRTGGGIAVLNGFFEDWTGTPVALFFVLLVAGLFSGRTAPTGILLMLAIVGVMGFVGLLVIDEVVWAFILLVGVLGLFVGKRFL